VPGGVPSRPNPLPPPRPGTAGPSGPSGPQAPARAQTVVPGTGGRPATPRPATSATAARPVRTRRARLTLRRVDPWSVFVMSLLLSLFLAVVTIVAAVVLYAVMDGLGIPASINKAVTDVQGGGAVLTRGRFLGGAALLAAVNVVLLTAFATLGSLLYNVTATFTGGLEVTLAERD
jgi:hypothetical protein